MLPDEIERQEDVKTFLLIKSKNMFLILGDLKIISYFRDIEHYVFLGK